MTGARNATALLHFVSEMAACFGMKSGISRKEVVIVRDRQRD